MKIFVAIFVQVNGDVIMFGLRVRGVGVRGTYISE